ncbi:MAG: hypothetical protein RQ751_02290 [Longimicrobiales bacterium]|nr:hypothetical protein [Longimicrobiales bacterium]
MTPRTHAPPRTRGGGFLNLLIPDFDEVRRFEPLLPPLLLVWVLAASTAFSLRPLAAASVPDGAGAALDFMNVLFWIAVLSAPLLHFVKATVLALLSWAVLVLAGAPCRLRSLVSVLILGEVVITGYGVLSALWLHLAPLVGIGSPGAVYDPLALAQVVPFDHSLPGGLIANLSGMHLIWTGFVAWALRRVQGLPLWGAAVLAIGMVCVLLAASLLGTSYSL